MTDKTIVEQPVAAPEEQPQLTIQDLQNLQQVIDLASSRGAFRTGEMTQVGAVYNKLAVFLSYIAATQTKTETV